MKINDDVLTVFYIKEPQLVKDMEKVTVAPGCSYVDVPFFKPGFYVRWNVDAQRFDLIKAVSHRKGERCEQTVILNKTREYLKR
jgi:hypothetical protein